MFSLQKRLFPALRTLCSQVAFIGGVADSSGYGWAIAKQLANAGATIIVGTWPPVLSLFERGIKKGFGEDSKLLDGSDMKIAKVFPLAYVAFHRAYFHRTPISHFAFACAYDDLDQNAGICCGLMAFLGISRCIRWTQCSPIRRRFPMT